MNGSRIHMSGPVTFSAPLGVLCGITAVAVPGSPAHVVASFVGGVRIEFSDRLATELARGLPEAIAKLPLLPDCSGMVWLAPETPVCEAVSAGRLRDAADTVEAFARHLGHPWPDSPEWSPKQLRREADMLDGEVS